MASIKELEAIEQLYAQGKALGQIAEAVYMSRENVRIVLKNADKIRRKAQRDERIIAAYNSGLSIAKTAKSLETTIGAVRWVLESHEVPRRKPRNRK